LNLERHLQIKEKNMIAKKILLALIVAAAMAVATTSARAQSAERSIVEEQATEEQAVHSRGLLDILARRKKAVAGSWLITAVVPGAPPFKALLTLTEDGNAVSAGQGDVRVPAPAIFSAYHGTWKHLGGRTFTFTILSIMYSPTTGEFAGLFKVRQTLTLGDSEDEWSGPGKLEIFDPAGNSVFALEGTAQAQRIKVEPLP
jgi:hypothetical protein